MIGKRLISTSPPRTGRVIAVLGGDCGVMVQWHNAKISRVETDRQESMNANEHWPVMIAAAEIHLNGDNPTADDAALVWANERIIELLALLGLASGILKAEGVGVPHTFAVIDEALADG